MTRFYAMSFRDEIDMLKCQLIQHAATVDKFVIMEANVDHSGQPKPFYLARRWDEFGPWQSQIEYVRADWLPTFDENPSYWYREQKQRDIGMSYLLNAAKPGDTIAVSDIDEFIPGSAFDTFDAMDAEAAACVQKLRFAAVDWDGSPGPTAVLLKASILHDGRLSLDTARQRRQDMEPIVPGGYHFSWFGGPERFRMKALCSPHQESLEVNLRLADEGYAWQRGLGGIPDNPTVTGNVAEITDDYPRWVLSRECPWFWWRPGPDMLPVDDEARQRELRRRAELPYVSGICSAGRTARILEPGSYHLDDFTPCPTVGR